MPRCSLQKYGDLGTDEVDILKLTKFICYLRKPLKIVTWRKKNPSEESKIRNLEVSLEEKQTYSSNSESWLKKVMCVVLEIQMNINFSREDDRK